MRLSSPRDNFPSFDGKKPDRISVGLFDNFFSEFGISPPLCFPSFGTENLSAVGVFVRRASSLWPFLLFGLYRGGSARRETVHSASRLFSVYIANRFFMAFHQCEEGVILFGVVCRFCDVRTLPRGVGRGGFAFPLGRGEKIPEQGDRGAQRSRSGIVVFHGRTDLFVLGSIFVRRRGRKKGVFEKIE